MNRTPTLTPQPGNRLWGIYHTDREYAREQGDPLRIVVEARTKIAAEELAAHLGFSDPWAHPITAEEAKRAQWSPKHRAGQRQFTHHHSTGIHV
jgi:hypothetical protein